MESVTGSPGLDLPALESAEIAKGYGVSAKRVDGRDELHAALTDALAADGPQLVEVKVAPGMALG
jgi:benzoylformate decarboxylase